MFMCLCLAELQEPRGWGVGGCSTKGIEAIGVSKGSHHTSWITLESVLHGISTTHGPP